MRKKMSAFEAYLRVEANVNDGVVADGAFCHESGQYGRRRGDQGRVPKGHDQGEGGVWRPRHQEHGHHHQHHGSDARLRLRHAAHRQRVLHPTKRQAKVLYYYNLNTKQHNF